MDRKKVYCHTKKLKDQSLAVIFQIDHINKSNPLALIEYQSHSVVVIKKEDLIKEQPLINLVKDTYFTTVHKGSRTNVSFYDIETGIALEETA